MHRPRGFLFAEKSETRYIMGHMSRMIIRTIGKLGSDWPKTAAQDYAARLSPFATLDLVELPEGHDGSAKPDLVRTRATEAESLLKGIPAEAFVIVLDEIGKQLSSQAFAESLTDWTSGGQNICFLLGGSWGLDERVRERADVILSFGKMTFPHALARVMLLEQLYRAIMIRSGKTYHK